MPWSDPTSNTSTRHQNQPPVDPSSNHLSNALAEGINSRIQHLIQKACGYRNRERFKRDVLFHLGGLDLYPERAQ
jgi:hypothetical protein